MRMGLLMAGIVAIVAIGAFVGCQSPATTATTQPQAFERVPDVTVGKYLILVGGCNDCHTPGYMQEGRMIPEDQWLVGMNLGFKGPWGTTYPSNLREFVNKTPEDMFVKVLRERKARPPMPWESIHAMNDTDLISMYRYIKSLPMKGDPIPEFVPAGVEPKTPYIVFEPVPPKTPGPAAANQPS